MLRLQCFGGLSLESPTESISSDVAQPLRLALLAVLAATPDREIRRDKLLALFWPDTDQRRAAAALTQALYVLRRDLGADLISGRGKGLRLNAHRLTSDVAEFNGHLSRGDLAAAVAVHTGPFLDGFHLGQSPDFEQWADLQRAQFSHAYVDALDSLASAADERGDPASAVKWWRARARVDPLNSRVAAAFVRALASSGDRGGAAQHIAEHQATLRRELGLDLDDELVALASQLRAAEPLALARVSIVEPNRDAFAAIEVSGAPEPRFGTMAVSSLPGTPVVVVSRARRSPMSRLWRRAWFIGSAGVVTVTLGYWVATGARPSRASVPGSSTVVAVMPFEVSGDSASRYLREGMPTLIAAKLTGPGGVRAVEPGLVLRSWRSASGTATIEANPTEFPAIARRVGAGLLMQGSVVATRARLIISARLVGVGDSAIRTAMSVEGPPDSLTGLVDHLVAQLLLGNRGENGPRLASITTNSLPALQAYLNGQEAYRRGAYRDAVHHFRIALAADSTFTLAGFGLGLASGFSGQPDDGGAALRAWKWRSKLSPADQLFLGMFTGLGTTRETQRQYRAAWERALHANPERPELWYHVGDMFFHGGELYAPESPIGSARNALTRSLELDSLFEPAVLHLFQLDARNNDTTEAVRLGRRYIRTNPVGDLAPYVRWRLAYALGDTLASHALHQAIDTMPWPSLRALVMTSQFDGIAPDDAARALAARTRQAVTTMERYETFLLLHTLALNRGKPGEALAATRGIESLRAATDEHLRLRVLDALYGNGDTTAANRAAADLARHNERPPLDSADRTRTYRDMCALEQWRLAHNMFDHTPHAIATLRTSLVTRGWTEDTEDVACSVVLDTWLATSLNASDRAAKLARLDSLVEDGPGMEDLLAYLPLIRARLHAAQGDYRGALHAAHRRFYLAYYPHYLAAHLVEEAHAAAMIGEWSTATSAYQHLLRLRDEPDASLAAQTRVIRQDYARVLHERNSRPAPVRPRS